MWWHSYSESKRMILSIITICVIALLVVLPMLIGWNKSHTDGNNSTKAYIECVRYHLPAECK